MATGMVLVIVSRNIDLSIGSMLGFTGMAMAMLQAEWIPKTFGLGFDQPWTWIVTLAFGLALGAVIGAVHGFVIAYIGVPSFIVTLGGLLVWRGLAFQLAQGQTIAPMDSTFPLLGGGPKGSLGANLSWLVAGLVVRRDHRTAHRRAGGGAASTASRSGRCPRRSRSASSAASSRSAPWPSPTRYPWPPALASNYAVAHGITEPPGGLIIPTGIAIPVLIALGIGAADDGPGDAATVRPLRLRASAATRTRPTSPASTRGGRS